MVNESLYLPIDVFIIKLQMIVAPDSKDYYLKIIILFLNVSFQCFDI